MAVVLALATTVVADLVITVIYGSAYAESARILATHIWALPAVFMGALLSKWLIIEQLQIFSLTRHGLGALLNVGMNILSIPSYGAVGAAIATVVSYSLAHYLACFTDRRTVPAGIMMTRAILLPVRLVTGRSGN